MYILTARSAQLQRCKTIKFSNTKKHTFPVYHTKKNDFSSIFFYLHSVFIGVADVHGLRIVAVHQFDQSIHQVVDVLERTGLLAVAVDGDVLVLQRLCIG